MLMLKNLLLLRIVSQNQMWLSCEGLDVNTLTTIPGRKTSLSWSK